MVKIFFTNSLCLEGNFFLERLLKIFNEPIKIIPSPSWIHYKNIKLVEKKGFENEKININILFNFTPKEIFEKDLDFGIDLPKTTILYLGYNFISEKNLDIFNNLYNGQKFTKNLEIETVIDENLTHQLFRDQELLKIKGKEFIFNPFRTLTESGNNLLIFNSESDEEKDEELEYINERFIQDKIKSHLQEFYKNGSRIGLLGKGMDIILNLQKLYNEANLIYQYVNLKNIFIDTPHPHFLNEKEDCDEIKLFN